MVDLNFTCRMADLKIEFNSVTCASWIFMHNALTLLLVIIKNCITLWYFIELSRYYTAESGWHEQTADCYKPVDIWEMDQIDR